MTLETVEAYRFSRMISVFDSISIAVEILAFPVVGLCFINALPKTVVVILSVANLVQQIRISASNIPYQTVSTPVEQIYSGEMSDIVPVESVNSMVPTDLFIEHITTAKPATPIAPWQTTSLSLNRGH